MINGKYVRLRSFEKADLEACKKWINDPEIARAVLRVLPVSMHEHIQWYEKIISEKNRVTFAIETTKNKQYIGNIGLTNIDWRNRKGNLWVYLDKKVWSRGYGKEAIVLLVEYAFKSLNLNKIYLDVGVFNEKAVRLYRSAGFKEEGILREDVYIDGHYRDVVRMSMLLKEFLKNWKE